jgi:hypothetical protein
MHRRLYKQLAALVIVAATSGCVQATRHSNTMVFGTNTSLGIKVGTDVAQVPSINVGYDRQEAVIMPLVANSQDNGSTQSPCDLSKSDALPASQYLVHPCSLVATNGGATDSYSVLASFGANFDGAVKGSDTKLKGGLAQYFATGMAAQLLAATGGAAVVATGEAALKSAEKGIGPSEAAMLFSTPATLARAKLIDDSMKRMRILIAGTADTEIPKKMKGFEVKLGLAAGALGIAWDTDCAKAGPCIAKVEEEKARFLTNVKLEEALSGWPNY